MLAVRRGKKGTGTVCLIRRRPASTLRRGCLSPFSPRETNQGGALPATTSAADYRSYGRRPPGFIRTG